MSYIPNFFDFALSFIDDGLSGLKTTSEDWLMGTGLAQPSSAQNQGENLVSNKGINFETFYRDLLHSAESQRDEAKKQREWAAEQALIAMNFEASQAALNREFQISSAREAMDFERLEAEKLRQWQEVQNQKAMDYNTEMSNTAYQRAVSDLKAAGLNPILAYARGASTPTGFTSSGASGSGFAASGSKGSGFQGSSQQANVRGQITELTGALSNLLSSAGKMVGALFT